MSRCRIISMYTGVRGPIVDLGGQEDRFLLFVKNNLLRPI